MDSEKLFLLVLVCFSVQSSHGIRSVMKLRNGIGSIQFDPTSVTQISWSPRAFLYRGFLTDAECDHLISLSKGKLERAMVVNEETGSSFESEVRTSFGMFLRKAQDEVVRDIEERISAWTFLPQENGEAMQILRYEHGQKYEPHLDVISSKDDEDGGGSRIATVLMYLSDVQEAGETVFPYSKDKYTQIKGEDWSDCAKTGFAVKPHKGDALLFFSLHPNTTVDEASLHGACPVIRGTKWSATKWIHVRSLETKAMAHPRASGCVDENQHCAAWAAAGECEKNPVYMMGRGDFVGYCRKSCKTCLS